MIRIPAAVILIVSAGLVHGAWTNRWRPSSALAALAKRFEAVPMSIGDWKATAFELDPAERAVAGATACLARVYSIPGRGVSVSVLLLGGLPGDISKHTPDVCYRVAGYTLDSPSAHDFPYGGDWQRRARFQSIVATRWGTHPTILRIFWSWNASKKWVATEEPRWRFASEPTLCKLYIVREIAGVVVDPGGDPCSDFLRVFLPELDRVVFSTPR